MFDKGDSHATTCHEGTEGRQRYSSTQCHKEVNGQCHFIPEKGTWYPLYRRLGGPQRPVFKLQYVHTIVSCYTVYAIPAASNAAHLYWPPGTSTLTYKFHCTLRVYYCVCSRYHQLYDTPLSGQQVSMDCKTCPGFRNRFSEEICAHHKRNSQHWHKTPLYQQKQN